MINTRVILNIDYFDIKNEQLQFMCNGRVKSLINIHRTALVILPCYYSSSTSSNLVF